MTITEVTDTTTVAGKTIKKFTTNLAASNSQAQDTTTWVCPGNITSVRYLVVAGGGAGGSNSGGGGQGSNEYPIGNIQGGSGIVILNYCVEVVMMRVREYGITW